MEGHPRGGVCHGFIPSCGCKHSPAWMDVHVSFTHLSISGVCWVSSSLFKGTCFLLIQSAHGPEECSFCLMGREVGPSL